MSSGIEQQTEPSAAGGIWPERCRLPAFDVDPTPLIPEALSLPPWAWVPHFRLTVYAGDWSGVALRSLGGDPDRIYPSPGANADDVWGSTPWLSACPATEAFIEALPFPTKSVRFLRLGPDSEIRPHNDPGLGASHGEVRLHIALTTNDAVSFTLAGEPVDLRPGECWYLDLDREHTATNRGAEPRIHLVIDGLVDDGLAALITASAPV